VLANLDAGRVKTACNQLGAFANQVRAQAGKHVTEEAAAQLLVSTGHARGSIGCR
jgi:hypothetical protein